MHFRCLQIGSVSPQPVHAVNVSEDLALPHGQDTVVAVGVDADLLQPLVHALPLHDLGGEVQIDLVDDRGGAAGDGPEGVLKDVAIGAAGLVVAVEIIPGGAGAGQHGAVGLGEVDDKGDLPLRPVAVLGLHHHVNGVGVVVLGLGGGGQAIRAAVHGPVHVHDPVVGAIGQELALGGDGQGLVELWRLQAPDLKAVDGVVDLDILGRGDAVGPGDGEIRGADGAAEVQEALLVQIGHVPVGGGDVAVLRHEVGIRGIGGEGPVDAVETAVLDLALAVAGGHAAGQLEAPGLHCVVHRPGLGPGPVGDLAGRIAGLVGVNGHVGLFFARVDPGLPLKEVGGVLHRGDLGGVGDVEIGKRDGLAAHHVGHLLDELVLLQVPQVGGGEGDRLVDGGVGDALGRGHPQLDIQLVGLPHLHDVGPVDLLLVEVLGPLQVLHNGLDTDILALHVGRDVALVRVGEEDVVVAQVQVLAGPQLHPRIRLAHLVGVHVDVLGRPLALVGRERPGVGVYVAVVAHVPILRHVILAVGLGIPQDVVGAGDHVEGVGIVLDGIAVLIRVHLVPLVVDVKDLVAVQVHLAGLGVHQPDAGRAAGAGRLDPLEGGIVGLEASFAAAGLLTDADTAEAHAGDGLGGFQRVDKLAVALVIIGVVLLYLQDDAVHLALLVAVPLDAVGFCLFLDLVGHIHQGQLALQGVVAGAVLHGGQRNIRTVAALADALAGQRIHPVDLVGKPLQILGQRVELLVVPLLAA